MSPLSSGDDRSRFAAGLLLLGAVHVGLFLNGNDNATPARLALSFVTSTALLAAAQAVRRRARAQQLARRSASVAVSSSAPASAAASSEVSR